MNEKPVFEGTLIDRKTVQQLTHKCAASIHNALNAKSPYFDPDFPRPIKLGMGRSNYWLEEEVRVWLAKQVALSRQPVRKGGAHR
jgi:prophage regulatory protein